MLTGDILGIRFATIENDYWQLRSGEMAHQGHPETFWIPSESDRRDLRVGQGAKLIFELEGVEEDGSTTLQGERMWVVVSEVNDGFYIGILTNEASLLEPNTDHYLCVGAEIPFLWEHVIDIEDPPEEYVVQCLSQVPARRWPR